MDAAGEGELAGTRVPLGGACGPRAALLPGRGLGEHDFFYAGEAKTERLVAGIWQTVLGIERVGIHDNFFDLGGHSLAASRLISRVIQTFQLDLPIKALFDAPTVALMAVIITQHEAKRVSEAELAQILRDVEAMTDAEAKRRLDEIDSTIVKS